MEEPMEELEAEQVFLLMRKEYRISRNVRAQWYFNHLDQVIQVPKRHHLVSPVTSSDEAEGNPIHFVILGRCTVTCYC